MEMPTPCSRCAEVCELNDMYADYSRAADGGGWPVVCRRCHNEAGEPEVEE